MDPVTIVLILFILALVLFATEWLPVDVTALLLLGALLLFGLLTPKEAFAGFGSDTVLTLASLFVLTRVLLRAGEDGGEPAQVVEEAEQAVEHHHQGQPAVPAVPGGGGGGELADEHGQRRGPHQPQQRHEQHEAREQEAQLGRGLLHQLLICALIEARSCERFRLLSEGLEDEAMRRFYHKFMVSEAGHYVLFMDLARQYFPEAEVAEAVRNRRFDAEPFALR